MYKLKLDMDGVIVDFVRGALGIHNVSMVYTDVRWNFYKEIGLTESEFWSPLGYKFWMNLNPHTDGILLIAEINRLKRTTKLISDIEILTSPCQTEGCKEGKMKWIERYLPEYVNKIRFESNKHEHASINSILIDDHDGNCTKFTNAGGKSVLVPRPWNENREWCDEHGSFNLEYTLSLLHKHMGY